MRQMIPSVLQITCDRCAMVIEDHGAATHIEVEPRYSQETCAHEYDLCPNCMAAFRCFLHKELP